MLVSLVYREIQLIMCVPFAEQIAEWGADGVIIGSAINGEAAG